MPKKKNDFYNCCIGEKLKFYRNACGYTQEQVAEFLNINRTTYTKYETGVSEPSHDILQKIVHLFKIDFNSVFSDDEQLDSSVSDFDNSFYNITNDEKKLLSIYRIINKKSREELIKYAEKLQEKVNN